MTRDTVIAIPLGDPNGIGPEIAVKSALMGRSGQARLVLVGDAKVVARYAGTGAVREVTFDALPPPQPGLIDCRSIGALNDADFQPGHCDAASGRATVAYAEAAIRAARSGRVQAVVACPHNETAIHAAGISFSGYPSLVARAAGLTEREVFLMLQGGGLRIVHATLHEGVATALARIDHDLIAAACRAAHDALRRFGIARPKIGLFGINPHAGENGLFGDEDERVTRIAATTMRDAGLDIIGPAGADLLLSQRACDVYVAMFHDQGHIPIKLLAERQSTAFSVGAGLIFASVGHGSAPDIAGQGVADATPLLSTLDIVSQALDGRGELVAA